MLFRNIILLIVIISLGSCSLTENEKYSSVSINIQSKRSITSDLISLINLDVSGESIVDFNISTTGASINAVIPKGEDIKFALTVTFASGLIMSGNVISDVKGSTMTISIPIDVESTEGIVPLEVTDRTVVESSSNMFSLGDSLVFTATPDDGYIETEWFLNSTPISGDATSLTVETGFSTGLITTPSNFIVTFKALYVDKLIFQNIEVEFVKGEVQVKSIIASEAYSMVASDVYNLTAILTPGYSNVNWYLDSDPSPIATGVDNIDFENYIYTDKVYIVKVKAEYSNRIEWDTISITVSPG